MSSGLAFLQKKFANVKMTIVFLCGSLEPGFDGVGDYTRRLASELVRQGHRSAIISLYDKWILKEYTETQKFDNVNLLVLRIPSVTNNRKRFNTASHFIERFNPNWLSLQYVPFTYSPKGLPFVFGSRLSKLSKGRKWHIMFHELWVGMAVQSTVKEVCWGWLQKKLIRSLIGKLNPLAVHTHTLIYQEQLRRIGANVMLLPLFGNIPRNEKCNKVQAEKRDKNENELIFVLFGGIHPNAPVNEFALDVAEFSKTKSSIIKLIVVGRNGTEIERWITAWEKAGLHVHNLGERPHQMISQVLENASFGITTTPFPLVEKSGAVAAMLEHQLPVICVAHPWNAHNSSIIPFIKGVIEYKKGELENCLSIAEKEMQDLKEIKVSGEFASALMEYS